MEPQHSSPSVPPARPPTPKAKMAAPEAKTAAPKAGCRSEHLWTSLRAQWLGLCRERKTRERDTS
jgi:hypothetical protein